MKLKFEKHLLFNSPYWFNGIYKIASYTFFNGYKCKTYYQVFKLVRVNWGDYLEPAKQHDKTPTFQECIDMATEHAANYTPTNAELKKAILARDRWLDVSPKPRLSVTS
jgi:hypothetical protein